MPVQFFYKKMDNFATTWVCIVVINVRIFYLVPWTIYKRHGWFEGTFLNPTFICILLGEGFKRGDEREESDYP